MKARHLGGSFQLSCSMAKCVMSLAIGSYHLVLVGKQKHGNNLCCLEVFRDLLDQQQLVGVYLIAGAGISI